MSFLKLQLIGNLGNDSIVNNVNGKKVINANVAVSEKWKDEYVPLVTICDCK